MAIGLLIKIKKTDDCIKDHVALMKTLVTLHPLGTCIGYHLEEAKVEVDTEAEVLIILEREQGFEEKDCKPLEALIPPHTLSSLIEFDMDRGADGNPVFYNKQQGKITSLVIPLGQTFLYTFKILIKESQRSDLPENPSIETIFSQLSIKQLYDFTCNAELAESLTMWPLKDINNSDLAGSFIQLSCSIADHENSLLKTAACLEKFSESLRKMHPDIKQEDIKRLDSSMTQVITIQMKINLTLAKVTPYDIEKCIRAALLLSGLHQTVNPFKMHLINQDRLNFEQAYRIGVNYLEEHQVPVALHYFKIAHASNDAPKQSLVYLELLVALGYLYYRHSGLLNQSEGDINEVGQANTYYTEAHAFIESLPHSEKPEDKKKEAANAIAMCTAYLNDRDKSMRDFRDRFRLMASPSTPWNHGSEDEAASSDADVSPQRKKPGNRHRLSAGNRLSRAVNYLRKPKNPPRPPGFGTDL